MALSSRQNIPFGEEINHEKIITGLFYAINQRKTETSFHSDYFCDGVKTIHKIPLLSDYITDTAPEDTIEKGFIHGLSNVLNVLANPNAAKKEDYCKMKQYHEQYVRLILQTRDIIDGKGEYSMSYKLLLLMAHEEAKCDITLKTTQKCLFYFVNPLPVADGNKHPYGSWKDIKKFSHYIYNIKKSTTSCKMTQVCNTLIQYCIHLYVLQLELDLEWYTRGDMEKISLCAKWVPREKSKYNWLFTRLAKTMFLKNTNHHFHDRSSLSYCYRKLRRLLASLNRQLDTVEIKQCAGNYSGIDYSKVPSRALKRQHCAFLNVTDNFKTRTRTSATPDRITASANYTQYSLTTSMNKHPYIRDTAPRHIMEEHVINGLTTKGSSARCDTQKQWLDYTSNIGLCGNMISMIDIRLRFIDPFIIPAAIGITACVSNKSSLGKYAFGFDNKTLLNLGQYDDDFCDMVEKIRNSEDMPSRRCRWDDNILDVDHVAEIILNHLVEKNIPPNKVEDLTLVNVTVLNITDRTIESFSKSANVVMERIAKLYHDTGIKHYGIPYKPIHIFYWNITYKHRIERRTINENMTVFCGYNNMIIDIFIKDGFQGLTDLTTEPYNVVSKLLENKRYNLNHFITTPHDWKNPDSVFII